MKARCQRSADTHLIPRPLPDFSRRHLLEVGVALPLWSLHANAASPAQARAHKTDPHTLRFPRDLGSHPEFAIEWWYLTGYLRSESGMASGRPEFGFQLTFFRSRVDATQAMSSAFAAKQLIFAHAAVTDVAGNKLWHDQRIARQGFGIAKAAENDTAITLRDWSLQHDAMQYTAHAAGDNFEFSLTLSQTQPLLLQGNQGLSRKGPQERQASFYYSLPQLLASGTLHLAGRQMPVQGTAWLDHEWSQELMHPQAVGWDWIGMNLFDGSALTAFRLRDKDGKAVWDGGSFRQPSMGATPHVFDHGDLQFEPVRIWTSPLTHASYPVEWIVRIHSPIADGVSTEFYTVKAVIDNQELDSRRSTGAVYWEGLSELFDSQGKQVGRGYLEMTGYAGALRL